MYEDQNIWNMIFFSDKPEIQIISKKNEINKSRYFWPKEFVQKFVFLPYSHDKRTTRKQQKTIGPKTLSWKQSKDLDICKESIVKDHFNPLQITQLKKSNSSFVGKISFSEDPSRDGCCVSDN